MKLKFKACKHNIYQGKYAQIFKILNKDVMFSCSEVYQSDDSKIINGYWHLEIVNEDNKPVQLDWNQEETIRNIKNLEII